MKQKKTIEKINKIKSVKVITGPMFAGKTTSLIHELNYQSQQLNRLTIVFKMEMDNRNKDYLINIRTHSNFNYVAKSVTKLSEITDYLKTIKQSHLQVIAFSEAHLFPEGFTDLIKDLSSKYKKILISGLDYDYRQVIFPEMKKIFVFAHCIKKLFASCHLCFQKAQYTKRLVPSKQVILIGGSEKYTPICNDCLKKK